jgi:Rieske Fe-S protein
MSTSDRRTFLRLVIAAPLAPSLAACGGGNGAGAETFGDVGAGTVTSTTVGNVKAIAAAPAFLGRDSKGLYAMTTTCTHQSCDLASQGIVTSTSITCGCHGSVYDLNGNVQKGPAPSPLQHFAVSVDGSGNITVHGGQPVSEDTRTSV